MIDAMFILMWLQHLLKLSVESVSSTFLPAGDLGNVNYYQEFRLRCLNIVVFINLLSKTF